MHTRGSESPVRTWRWIANIASVYLLACLAGKAAAIDCYCNSGGGCVNNKCTLNGGHCKVELKQAGGDYQLDYFCTGGLLGCISVDPHDCCSYPDCNRCRLPVFDNVKYPVPEGVDVVSLLPPECPRGNITILTPPPAPPFTDSSSYPTNFPSTTPPPGGHSRPGIRLSLPPWLYAIICLSIILIILCILFLLLMCWVCHRRRHRCEVDSIGSVSISEMGSFPWRR